VAEIMVLLYSSLFSASAQPSPVLCCGCLTNRFGPLLESFLFWAAAGDCVTDLGWWFNPWMLKNMLDELEYVSIE
jgi:hypothetical protein